MKKSTRRPVSQNHAHYVQNSIANFFALIVLVIILCLAFY